MKRMLCYFFSLMNENVISLSDVQNNSIYDNRISAFIAKDKWGKSQFYFIYNLFSVLNWSSCKAKYNDAMHFIFLTMLIKLSHISHCKQCWMFPYCKLCDSVFFYSMKCCWNSFSILFCLKVFCNFSNRFFFVVVIHIDFINAIVTVCWSQFLFYTQYNGFFYLFSTSTRTWWNACFSFVVFFMLTIWASKYSFVQSKIENEYNDRINRDTHKKRNAHIHINKIGQKCIIVMHFLHFQFNFSSLMCNSIQFSISSIVEFWACWNIEHTNDLMQNKFLLSPFFWFIFHLFQSWKNESSGILSSGKL